MLDQIERRVYNVENEINIIKMSLEKNNEQHELIIDTLNELKVKCFCDKSYFSGLNKAILICLSIFSAIGASFVYFIDHVLGKN